MSVSKLFAAVAVSALVAAPALANPAAPLSLAQTASVKAKTSAKKSNKITPELGIIALVVAGAAVYIAVDSSDDDSDSD